MRIVLPDSNAFQRNSAFKMRWGPGYGELFYALAGARVGYVNSVLEVTRSGSAGPYKSVKWKFSGTLQVHDTYTFPNIWYRNAFGAYDAARILEETYKYREFEVRLDWRDVLQGTALEGPAFYSSPP